VKMYDFDYKSEVFFFSAAVADRIGSVNSFFNSDYDKDLS
jgi:hypothetical protein